MLGNLRVSQDLTVFGLANLLGTLVLSGNISTVANLTVSGNANILGNLGVTRGLNVVGQTNLLNTLSVDGNLNTSSNLIVSGNANVTGNLGVSGNSSFANVTAGNMTVSQLLQVNGSIATIGSSTLGNGNDSTRIRVNGYIDNFLSVGYPNPSLSGSNVVVGTNGSLLDCNGNIYANVYLIGNVGILSNGNANILGNLGVLGNIYGSSNLMISGYEVVTGNANVGGNLGVIGNIYGSSNLIITGYQRVTGNANIDGNIGVVGNLYTSNIENKFWIQSANLTTSGNLEVGGNLRVTRRIGVNTFSPAYDIDVVGNIRASDEFRSTTANIDILTVGTINATYVSTTNVGSYLTIDGANNVSLGCQATAGNIYIGNPGAQYQNIFIGGTNDNVYIGGNVTYIDTTNTNVKDALLTLNKGGVTYAGSGIEIESSNVIVASLKLAASGDFLLSDANSGVFNLHSTGMGDFTLYDLKSLTANISGNLWVGGNANVTGNLGVGNISPEHKFRVDGNVHFGINGALDINRYGIVTVSTRDGDNTSAVAIVREDNYVWKMGYRNDGTNDLWVYDGTNGVKLAAGNNQNWASVSDQRFKKNIIEIQNSLEKVKKITGVYYNFKGDGETASRKVGVIAQDVHKALPEAVDLPSQEELPMTVRYSELIPILINSVKELEERISSIEEILSLKI